MANSTGFLGLFAFITDDSRDDRATRVVNTSLRKEDEVSADEKHVTKTESVKKKKRSG